MRPHSRTPPGPPRGTTSPGPPAPDPANPADRGDDADLAAAAQALSAAILGGATLWVYVSPRQAPSGLAASALDPTVLDGADPVAQARAAALPGDALLLVAPAADATACDLALRARAWGTPTWWIGQGPRPQPGQADHVLWLPSPGETPAAASALTRRVMDLAAARVARSGAPAGSPLVADGCAGDTCVTCSDEGRLAEVVSAPSEPFAPALVRTPAGREPVDITLVGPVRPGDLVLIHAGMALTRLDPHEGRP